MWFLKPEKDLLPAVIVWWEHTNTRMGGRALGRLCARSWVQAGSLSAPCRSSLLKADYFSCVATVVYLRKENSMYQACPTQDCNKKVIDQQNGLYRCEKCDREFPNFKYRMILSVSGMGRWEPLWRLRPSQVPGTIETAKQDHEQVLKSLLLLRKYKSRGPFDWIAGCLLLLRAFFIPELHLDTQLISVCSACGTMTALVALAC